MRAKGFFTLLAELNADSPAWPLLSGGMVTVRAAGSALAGEYVGAPAIAAVLGEIRGLLDFRVRRQLMRLVELTEHLIATQAEPARTELGKELLQYGLRLHADGYALAGLDVFTIVSEARGVDSDILLLALLRRAFAFRFLKRHVEARLAYRYLERMAIDLGSRHMQLEAQLGRGRIALDRGNIPSAARIIDRVIKIATEKQEAGALAMARIEAARIAGIRRQPARSLVLSYLAFLGLKSRIQSDRVLNNIGYALREVGRLDAASDVADWCAKFAVDADQRIVAETLRYHLAVDRWRWSDADDIRERLRTAKMEPEQAAEFYEAQVRHESGIGRFREAARLLDCMEAIAAENKLSELLFKCDEARTDVAAGRVPRVYDFQPFVIEDQRTEQRVNRIERSLQRRLRSDLVAQAV